MKKILIAVLLSFLLIFSINNLQAQQHMITHNLLTETGYQSIADIEANVGENVTVTAHEVAEDEVFVGWILDGKKMTSNTTFTFAVTGDHELISVKRKNTNYVGLFFNHERDKLIDYAYYQKTEVIETLVIYPNNEVPEGFSFGGWISNEYDTLGTKPTSDMYFYPEILATALEHLPITDGEQIRVSIDPIEGGYRISFNDGIHTERIKVTNLPEWLVNSKEVYYYTDEAENRLFVGFYDARTPFKNLGSYSNNLIANSWIVYNITTGDYRRSEFNVIHAKLFSVGNGWTSHNHLYADISIPHDMDKLLSMTVYYEYKHKFLNGTSSTDWIEVKEQLLLADRKIKTELPWYHLFINSYQYFYQKYVTRLMYWDKEIKDITESATPAYKADFIQYLEDSGSGSYSINEVFPENNKVYRLFLGQKNAMFSTAVWAKEFAVLTYRYEVDGKEFSNPFPVTEAPPMPEPPALLPEIIPDPIKDFFSGLWAFIVKFMFIAIPVIALLTVKFPMAIMYGAFGKKANKHRGTVALVWVVSLTLIFYLLLIKFGNV